MKLLRYVLPAGLREPATQFLRVVRDPRGELARGLLETRRKIDLTIRSIGDETPAGRPDSSPEKQSPDRCPSPAGTELQKTSVMEELQLLGLQLSHAGVTGAWILVGGGSDLMRALRRAVAELPSAAESDDMPLRDRVRKAAPQTRVETRLSLFEFGCRQTNRMSTLRLSTGIKQLDYSGQQWLEVGEVQQLAKLRSLEMLSLDGLEIHDSDLAVIARLPALRRLYLDGCQVTDAGLRQLAPLRQLEVLSLRDTRVTSDGMKALSALLGLKHLQLAGTDVGDAGLCPLAELPALERLELDQSRVTAAGVSHLATFPKLKSVSLDGLPIGETDVDALLSSSPGVRSLSLFGTAVDRLGAERLAARWPNGEFDC